MDTHYPLISANDQIQRECPTNFPRQHKPFAVADFFGGGIGPALMRRTPWRTNLRFSGRCPDRFSVVATFCFAKRATKYSRIVPANESEREEALASNNVSRTCHDVLQATAAGDCAVRGRLQAGAPGIGRDGGADRHRGRLLCLCGLQGPV